MILEILWIWIHEAYKNISPITKNNLKMQLSGYWHPLIILIITSISKVFK